jgi:phospholipid/cholesterol/gamma-HCH transport system substrate-binding protein
VPYDPATGDYIGPDGKRYTQADLAHPGNKTWQSMLVPPAPTP